MRDWLIDARGNITQKDIAQQCSISQNYYSWIEIGERTPSVETAKKIAKVLGFDWTRFYEDTNKNREAV